MNIEERLIGAFLALLMAGGTLVLTPFVVILASPRGADAYVFLFYGIAFSPIGLAFLVTSLLFGFALGSERMISAFSLLWGTHPAWENEWFKNAVGAVCLVLLIGFFIYLAAMR